MNKFIIATIVVVVAGISIAFASPLFYNTEINEPIPGSMMDDTMMDDTMMDDTMMDDTMMDDTMMSKSYHGTFVGVGDGIHDVEGKSKVLFLDDGREILRLEDFKSTNGPDLYVYLSTDTMATDIVNLGALKANIGNQNYDIPEGTDLEKYNQVLIWCKSFSVLFGSAELTANS
ncbi:MAG: DM13 domain-containing protein [Nitrosarchaeum sp.]|nr:DM13 domain-containing protein [Nitrosarchaeum sp.]